MTDLDDLLIFAARAGNDALVRDRIAGGAKVNHMSPRHGSALLQAVRTGHASVVSTLLEHGADPNAADCFGDGPLEYALRFGEDEIALRLLQAGAKLQPRATTTFRELLSECLRRAADRGQHHEPAA